MAKETGITKPNGTQETGKLNLRIVLYIFLLPLILIDWAATIVFNLVEVIVNALRELTLSLKDFIHAEGKPVKTEQPK